MFKKTLRIKIIFSFLLVGFLPLIIIVFLHFTQTQYSLKETVSENLISLAHEVMDKVDKTIRDACINLELLANNPLIKSKEATKEEKLSEMQKTQDFYRIFEDITLADLNGNVITSTTYSYRGEWITKEWYLEAREGNSTISNVHIILSPYKVVIISTTPVMDKNGEVISVITGQMNMEKIWEITDNVKVGKEGFVFIINKEGNFIAYPDKEKVLYRVPYLQAMNQIYYRDKGIITYTHENGNEMIGSFVSPSDPELIEKGWKLIVTQPKSEAFALVNILQQQIFIISLGGSTLVLLVSLFLSDSIIKPIRKLTDATNKISKGDINIQLPVESSDEIGQLTKSFNIMNKNLKKSQDQLKKYSKELEKKVKQRTRQLDKKIKESEKMRIATLNILGDVEETRKRLAKAYKELKSLDKMKADFMNVAAHELKTPLIPIIGYVDILTKEDLGKITEKQKNALEIVMKNTKRMQKLVQDVLDIAKLESKIMKFTTEKLQITKVIKTSVESMKPLAKEKNLNIILKMPEELPLVKGDEIRLTQVMANLFDNAIKFTEKGQITVEAGLKGNKILVKVKDTGIGISKKFMPKVFKKFEQEDVTKHKYGGTGLGLSICKEIIEAHKGKIWVKSRKGRGSTFYFTLPVKK